jgi:hypothetical protein
MKLLDLSDILLLIVLVIIMLDQFSFCKYYSIDLTFERYQLPNEQLCERFSLHVLSRIYKNIQLLTVNIPHVLHIVVFANKNCNGTFPNVTYLKIMSGKYYIVRR